MSFTYRGLEATLERHLITESETTHQLERLRQQSPRIANITDRPTQQGDEVVLDYAGFCNGVQFEGGTAENQTLTLGSGTFIPGFEEQLLDKVPGESLTVHVTFPEKYHAADLAGQAAEFRCVIHQIRVKTAYELDDTFAKEVGQCETLEEMRQKLHESLQAYSDERGEMDLQDKLLRQAAETLEVEISEEAVDQALDTHIQGMKAQLAQQGLTMEMYCQFMNTTEAALREDARPEARNTVRFQAAIDEIVRLENLEVTQEEISQACALICRQNRITMEQLKECFNEELESAIVRNILSSKAMSLIREAAQVTVVEN